MGSVENDNQERLLQKSVEHQTSAEECNKDVAHHEDVEPLKALANEYENYLEKSFDRLKLKSHIKNLRIGPKERDVSSNALLRSRAEMLNAELDVARKAHIVGYPNHPPLLLQLAKENLKKEVNYLEQGLASLHTKRASLRRQNERLGSLLEHERNTLTILKKESEVEVKEETFSEGGSKIIQDLEDKIEKVKKLTQMRMEQLENFLIMNFPPPDGKAVIKSRKQGVLFEEIDYTEIKTLAEVLEECMNRWLDSPHDPWVTLDETFWLPHVELLLRTRILQRHHKNHDLVKIGGYQL